MGFYIKTLQLLGYETSLDLHTFTTLLNSLSEASELRVLQIFLLMLQKPCDTEGQLISKGLFDFFNSPKKWTKFFCPKNLSFQVHSLEELETLKRHFEINWPLASYTPIKNWIIYVETICHSSGTQHPHLSKKTLYWNTVIAVIACHSYAKQL